MAKAKKDPMEGLVEQMMKERRRAYEEGFRAGVERGRQLLLELYDIYLERMPDRRREGIR